MRGVQWNPLIWTPLGQKKESLLVELYVRAAFRERKGSLLERYPYFRGVHEEGFHCMYVYLIAGDLFWVFLDGLDDFCGAHGSPLVVRTTLIDLQQLL